MSHSRDQFIIDRAIQGAVVGAIFGGIASLGPLAAAFTGAVGIGAGISQLILAFEDMLLHGVNPCNAFDAAVGVAGIVGGAWAIKANFAGAVSQIRNFSSQMLSRAEFQLPRGTAKRTLRNIAANLRNADAFARFGNNPEITSRIPPHWGPGENTQTGGWRWSDPANPSGNIVRIDVGRPELPSNLSSQWVDHVAIQL
jgi:hypothetical protein